MFRKIIKNNFLYFLFYQLLLKIQITILPTIDKISWNKIVCHLWTWFDLQPKLPSRTLERYKNSCLDENRDLEFKRFVLKFKCIPC